MSWGGQILRYVQLLLAGIAVYVGAFSVWSGFTESSNVGIPEIMMAIGVLLMVEGLRIVADIYNFSD
jgi:hypothetical protein